MKIINKLVFKSEGVVYNAITFTEEEFLQKFGISKKDFFKEKKEVKEVKKKKQLLVKPKSTLKKNKRTQ